MGESLCLCVECEGPTSDYRGTYCDECEGYLCYSCDFAHIQNHKDEAKAEEEAEAEAKEEAKEEAEDVERVAGLTNEEKAAELNESIERAAAEYKETCKNTGQRHSNAIEVAEAAHRKANANHQRTTAATRATYRVEMNTIKSDYEQALEALHAKYKPIVSAAAAASTADVKSDKKRGAEGELDRARKSAKIDSIAKKDDDDDEEEGDEEDVPEKSDAESQSTAVFNCLLNLQKTYKSVTEGDVAAALNVNTATVREILHQLRQDHLVAGVQIKSVAAKTGEKTRKGYAKAPIVSYTWHIPEP